MMVKSRPLGAGSARLISDGVSLKGFVSVLSFLTFSFYQDAAAVAQVRNL